MGADGANLFVVTASNAAAKEHLNDSIRSSIPLGKVEGTLSAQEFERAAQGTSDGHLYAWGAEPTRKNRSYWQQMRPGDYVLVYENRIFTFLAQVVSTVENAAFAKAVWGLNEETGATWELAYFLTKPAKIHLPAADLADVMQTQFLGFQRVNPDRILKRYGSVGAFVGQRLAAATTQVQNPTERFRALIARYHDEGTVFESADRGALYTVQSIDDAGCIVDRLTATEPARCTFGQFESLRERIAARGGRHPFTSELEPTVAIRTTVAQAPELALSPDGSEILLLEGRAQVADLLMRYIEDLQVDRSGGAPKMYKPALLACVLEAIGLGELRENRIAFDWIEPRFRARMKELGQDVSAQQAAYPFFHLTRDLLWMLCYREPTDAPRLASDVSPTTIKSSVRHAILKDTFWDAMQDSAQRERVLNHLAHVWWAPTTQRAWIFQANPALYDLQGALASGLTNLQWTVRQHRDQIKAGDLVFLWESGSDAGIVAVAGVLNDPADEDEDPVSRQFNRQDEPFAGPKLRVRLRIDRLLPERVRRETLRAHPILRNLSILAAPQGTNFPIVPNELWPIEALVAANGGRLVRKIAPGRDAKFWDECLREGYICVAWDLVGDLRRYEGHQAARAAFSEAYAERYNHHEPQITKKATELWTLRDLRPGDIIVANRGTSEVLALGRVLDPSYEWRSERPDHKHTVRVRWDTSFAKHIPKQADWAMATVAPVRPDLFRLIIGDSGPMDDLSRLAEELLLDRGQLERAARLLRDKRQVIFYGPPGTGKTFVARKLAAHVDVVQFHPSVAYEDFFEGFRPDEEGQFRLKPGPLRRIAKRAQDDTNKAIHVLIIDELNRGNVAKVFGELYYLLEYRNEKVWLQYSETKFSLPENLWIIGTMNTADRSIALVDAALRRRFYFVPFFPDEPLIGGLLRGWLARHMPHMLWVADVVREANERLGDRHGAIGPSHFLREDLDDEWVELIWEHSVLPYLEEQLLGEEERLKTFRLAALRKGTEGERKTDDGPEPDDA
jgi:hypothetical protein